MYKSKSFSHILNKLNQRNISSKKKNSKNLNCINNYFVKNNSAISLKPKNNRSVSKQKMESKMINEFKNSNNYNYVVRAYNSKLKKYISNNENSYNSYKLKYLTKSKERSNSIKPKNNFKENAPIITIDVIKNDNFLRKIEQMKNEFINEEKNNKINFGKSLYNKPIRILDQDIFKVDTKFLNDVSPTSKFLFVSKRTGKYQVKYQNKYKNDLTYRTINNDESKLERIFNKNFLNKKI